MRPNATLDVEDLDDATLGENLGRCSGRHCTAVLHEEHMVRVQGHQVEVVQHDDDGVSISGERATQLERLDLVA